MDTEKWVKMSVTYCVPFCTATYGQMIAILKKPKKQYKIKIINEILAVKSRNKTSKD